MAQLLLVHWNAAEAATFGARLAKAGHRLATFSDPGSGIALRAVRADPPDAVLIVLDRLPSHGRAVAQWFRQQKATRRVPLIFVGGVQDKVERVRGLLPDATYTTWARVRGDIGRAMKNAPAQPVVPPTMAGYSGTPLPKKLGIKPDARVALLGAPPGFETTLGSLPEGVALRHHARAPADVVLVFTRSQAELARRFTPAAKAMAAGGRLWILWPKRASGVQSDLSEAEVRSYGLGRDFVDYKIAAIDATWSGLCFARRGARAASPAR